MISSSRSLLFRAGAAVLLAALVFSACTELKPATGARSGEVVYRKDCARCHGRTGEGVAGKCDESLRGTRSVENLTRYIHKKMPEDRKGSLSEADSAAVAAYIHESFYSPEAQARIKPERVELARLTIGQFQNSLADLVGSFRPSPSSSVERGLSGTYYNARNREDDKKVLTRTDAGIDFDFGADSPDAKIGRETFSIYWRGAVTADDTGWYEFRLRTHNGARLFVNTDRQPGDKNQPQPEPLIDGWVSSGLDARELTGRIFLLGGRPHPLQLDFFKLKEKSASIRLEWKPPHQTWQVIPADHLSPSRVPVVTAVSTPFPADDGSLGYERGTSVAKEWDRAVTEAAIATANEVVQQADRLAGIPADAKDRGERLKTFCGQFAERAFRRPLSPEQRQLYVDRQFAEATNSAAALKRSVILVLKSPRFLYPETGATRPDDWTIAARLALTLWDSLPDADLRRAAAAGQLHTADQVRAQIRRMMADARVKAKVRGFFEHWLAMDAAEEIAKDRTAYPDFNEQIVADARESLERFVDHVVWSDRSDYRELLTADYLFVNARLAKFYGAGTAAGEEFVLAKVDPKERAGIFTHPYLLSAFAYTKSSSPIHRGVFLTRNVMGRFLRPPPMAIAFMDDKFDPSLTMREKVAQLTGKDACMGCHAVINPLGFSLEHFDAVGRFRTTDNNKPVDASSDYTTAEGDTIRIRGPRDLADYAVMSRDAQTGFVRQLFHHVVKQSTGAYGPQTLDRLHDEFLKSGCNIRELVEDIAELSALHGTGPQVTLTENGS